MIYDIYIIYIFYMILAGMKSVSLHCFDSSAGFANYNPSCNLAKWQRHLRFSSRESRSLAVGQSCRKELLHSKPVQQNNIYMHLCACNLDLRCSKGCCCCSQYCIICRLHALQVSLNSFPSFSCKNSSELANFKANDKVYKTKNFNIH